MFSNLTPNPSNSVPHRDGENDDQVQETSESDEGLELAAHFDAAVAAHPEPTELTPERLGDLSFALRVLNDKENRA